MIDAAILTTLIPGSVWARAKRKGDPAHSTVLHITNQSLTEAKQEEFPPQVVFVNESGKIFSQPIDLFLSRRTFVTVNAAVDALLSQVMEAALEDEEEGNIKQFENIVLPANTEADTETEDKDDGSTDMIADASPFRFNEPVEGAEELASSFARYTEVRDGANLMIGLIFLLDELTVEQLEKAFAGDVGFTIEYQIGVQDCVESFPAGSWKLLPTQLEIGSSGNAYAHLNLVLDTSVFTPVDEEEKVAPQTVLTGDVQVTGTITSMPAVTSATVESAAVNVVGITPQVAVATTQG